MRGLVLASVLLTFAGSFANAQDNECTLENDHCVPLVGCVAETGELFLGHSFGKRRGGFFAGNQRGAECLGAWNRNMFGVGEGDMICNDERQANIKFTVADQASGSLTGSGKLNTGNTIIFWIGRDTEALLASNLDFIAMAQKCVSKLMK